MLKKIARGLATLATCGILSLGFNFDKVEAAENNTENLNIFSGMNQEISTTQLGGFKVIVVPPGRNVPPPVPPPIVPPPITGGKVVSPPPPGYYGPKAPPDPGRSPSPPPPPVYGW